VIKVITGEAGSISVHLFPTKGQTLLGDNGVQSFEHTKASFPEYSEHNLFPSSHVLSSLRIHFLFALVNAIDSHFFLSSPL